MQSISTQTDSKTSIAILYICTGKYVTFWAEFYRSAEQYFVQDATKHYFVFTDAAILFGQAENPNIHLVYQERLGWPDDTLKRFHLFSRLTDRLASYNYIFFFNANAQILKPIRATDILPSAKEQLVAALHPGYFDKTPRDFTYESKQKRSLAFIEKGSGQYYFAGGLNGGTSTAYLDLIVNLQKNVELDSKRGLVAVWHDESHLNKYLLNRSPKILPPSYIYPEGWSLPFEPIILIRDKSKHGGHAFLRNQSEKKSLLKKIVGHLKKIIYK